jgi:hypothetical protein
MRQLTAELLITAKRAAALPLAKTPQGLDPVREHHLQPHARQPSQPGMDHREGERATWLFKVVYCLYPDHRARSRAY